jgi:hypothetical protein
MSSGGGPGLQSRVGGNRIAPGGFDSHPFRQIRAYRLVMIVANPSRTCIYRVLRHDRSQ